MLRRSIGIESLVVLETGNQATLFESSLRPSSNGKATGRLPVYRSSSLRGRTNLAGRATAGAKAFEEVRDEVNRV